MATYDAWNRAIAAYFTAGTAKGSPIFLSVDLEALEEIAGSFLEEPIDGDPSRDFVEAVRHRCILRFSGAVSVDDLKAPIGAVPGGVGFLGLLVFAAYNMQEEQGIDESNYFLRLREVLRLPVCQGRPEGLPAGAEEPLWKAWNQYLAESGFQQTAERGAGPQTYLRYILSQAILRESDKQYLRQRFRDAHLPPQFDCDQLGFWLSRQQVNRRHLTEGLHHPDPGRVWEFYRAAHRVYEAGDWIAGGQRRGGSVRTASRSIECGLYRSEDLLGDAEYWAFPKQPARIRSTSLTASVPGDTTPLPLRQLRAGFFAPLWRQDPFADAVVERDVAGDPNVQKLLFPKRDFWVLVRDPENPSGPWASWKPYLELGEQLLLLCRPGVFDHEMSRFREAKLLQWTARVEQSEWIEYQGCMVLSYEWGGFIATPECRALADALAPRAMAGVSLQGGLRDPNQNAWLEGFPPSLKVYGFEREYEVIVTASDGQEVLRQDVVRQSEVALPGSLEVDSYMIEARFNGKRAALRVLRIAPWDSIQEHPAPETVTNSQVAATAGLPLRGAMRSDLAVAEEEVARA